jgi:uncharacterized cupin superfamily protein
VSRNDEFIHVLEDEVTPEKKRRVANPPGRNVRGLSRRHRRQPSLRQSVLSRHCAAGVGDRTANDEISYPDIDMHLQPLPDGTRRFTRKDGTPY